MNNMVCHSTESKLDVRCMSVETTALEDLYSTTPLKIIGSVYQQPNEDELHSAFDEAISERVLTLNKQRMSISIPRIDSVSSLPSIQTDALLSGSSGYSIAYGMREMILLVAVALMLILVGFDLMGLLVFLKF